MFGRKKREEELSGDGILKRKLSKRLEKNIDLVEELFKDVDILRSRQFCNRNDPKARFAIFHFDGVCNSAVVTESIVKPLLTAGIDHTKDLFEVVKDSVIFNNEVTVTDNLEKIMTAVSYGDTLLFVDGSNQAVLLNSKGFALRSVTEPEGERVLSGPREGFTESIMTNLSMIRRRLLTHQLKMRMLKLGEQSHTSVCLVYMENIVNKKILEELQRRLDKIALDGILDSNYIVEYIAEKSYLGLNTTGSTERPDVIAGKLLEGRIAIFLDGTPVVLTVPYLFIENFQSGEDYYMNPVYTSFGRIIRILCFLFTCTVSALYISVVAYHHEVLPSNLIVKFAGERANAPLSAAPECFLMLFLFDILREAGVRMPNHVGQAMSIVGALVIGQSAVEASLVAAPMVIIVAFTGITILLVPRLTTTSLIARYLCLLLASFLGFTGVVVGMSIIAIHLLNLRTMGVPYVLPNNHLAFQDVKDVFIRAPWPLMLTRIMPLSPNKIRQGKRGAH